MTEASNLQIVARQTVAIVGATGAVGAELIGCLERRDYPVGELRLLASPRSAGRTLPFRGREVVVEVLAPERFHGVDVALFAAGKSVSREYAPIAMAAGATVIDNSSAFRLDPDRPLVVPEVNGRLLDARPQLIANPNCVAVIAVMALAPIHARNPVRRVIGSTYQAASGAGAAAMEELREATAAALAGEAFTPKVLPHPYGFNVFSHNTDVDPGTGYNDEEAKVMAETRKMLDAPDLRISFTCVRVPVPRAHTLSLNIECERPLDLGEVEAWLTAAPGVRIVNDWQANRFPMPIEASGVDEVLAGRIRHDASDPSGRSIHLMLAGDQLLKGAALNAVQIAEALRAA